MKSEEVYSEIFDVKKDELDEAYSEIFEKVKKNLPRRVTLKLVPALFSGESVKKLEVAYLYLRLIDDLVDSPRPEGEDTRRILLDDMEKRLYEIMPDEASRKILKEPDPLNAILEKADINLLTSAFLATYGPAAQKFEGVEYLKEFYKGMRTDIEKEGKLFTRDELYEFFERIQNTPNMIVLKAIDFDFNGLPEGQDYNMVYDVSSKISRAVMLIKGSRPDELYGEDVLMDRVYVSKEELDSAGITRDEFVKNALERTYDPRMSKIVKGRIKEAYAYLNDVFGRVFEMPSKGTLGESKRFLIAYGFVAKHWAKKLYENGYNPLKESGEFADMSMSKMEKLGALAKSKAVGLNGFTDRHIYNNLLKWDFLD